MIRMEDDHMVGVVDNALTASVKLADDVDIRSFCASGIVPRLSQQDDIKHARPVIFDREHLSGVRSEMACRENEDILSRVFYVPAYIRTGSQEHQ